jgi:cystathionine beta-synthase
MEYNRPISSCIVRSTNMFDGQGAGMDDQTFGIGNTPLVRIANPRGVRLFAKLEQYNPGGSIKDRIAAMMIAQAEVRGDLRPGMAIVESSSGNTAIGLAMLAARKGYRVYAVCDRNVPAAKLARIAALGAHIVYLPPTPAGFDSVELRIALADRLAARVPGAISTAQFSNPDNALAHVRGTGPEIWTQTGGAVRRVVAAAGTCGTVTGVGRYLKSRDRTIEMRAVEPLGSTIFGGRRGNFLIQGGGLSFTPSLLDRSVVDVSHHVTDAQAIAAIYRFAGETGLLVGGTAGWVLHDLYGLAETAAVDETIVGILPDGGDRYLDTIYAPEWLAAHGFAQPRAVPMDAIVAAAAALDCTIDAFGAGGDVVALYRAMGLAVPDALHEAADAV